MTDPIEQIFQEVVMMTPHQKPDTNPYESEEYAKFVESMAEYCHCRSSNRPCGGVLAGGLCDGMTDEPDTYESEQDWDDE